MSKAVIVGTGGHAQVIWAAWQAVQGTSGGSPIDVVGWLEYPDYQGTDRLLGLPVFTETDESFVALSQLGVRSFYFGLGMIKAMPTRWDIFQRIQAYGLTPETLIHPTAIVDHTAIIEPGCVIGVRAVIQPFARLGAATIVNTGSIVEHHACIGHNVHLAPGSITCGNTQVGAHSLVGAGAVVLQQVLIGQQVTIGAGSVVTQTIGDGITAVGSPIRSLPKTASPARSLSSHVSLPF